MDRTPPTADDLIDLLRRTMAPEYWRSVEADDAKLGLYRGMAEEFATLGRRLYKMTQSGYYLGWSEAGEEPATFARRATFDVDLHRAAMRDQGVSMDAGRVWLKGPQGRRYRNTTPIVWPPYGTTTQRVVFEAEHPGWVYDLDFLADADGLLTEPQSDPAVAWTSRVGFPPESPRSGTGATLAVAGPTFTLTDSGGGDLFSPADVGRYVRLTDAVNAANRGRIVRVARAARAVTDSPVGSGIFTSTITIDTAGEAWALLAVLLDDGGAFTAQPGPYALLPAVPAAGDAIYFGLHEPFTRLDFTVTTATSGDIKLAWEAWDGAAWVEVAGLVDGTATLRQSGAVTWEEPAGWASTTVGGVAAFWLRARADTASAATGGEASVAFASVPYGLVAEAASVSWQMLRWEDLGFEITRMTAPEGGRDNTLGMLGAERKVHPIAGETEAAFQQRAARRPDAVSPLAIHSALNRVLAPYGLRGRVMDTQTDGIGGPGFPGMFYDVPPESFPAMLGAYDLYAPGDPVLPSPHFVPIATWQATRHFWVFLPPMALGHFGFSYDDGPTLINPDGDSLGGAWDAAVWDGYAVTTEALHSAVYQSMRALKLFGVSMTFQIDETLIIPC
jgi:hypothetical protein